MLDVIERAIHRARTLLMYVDAESASAILAADPVYSREIAYLATVAARILNDSQR